MVCSFMVVGVCADSAGSIYGVSSGLYIGILTLNPKPKSSL